VKLLYRNICKTLFDYSSSRAVWGEFIKEARDSFEANKNLTDDAEIEKKIKAAEQWLIDYKHPDPYRVPTNPGGSKFQRNVPPDLEVVEKLS